MVILRALSKVGWIPQAFRESWNQKGLLNKIKHLKYRLSWELRPMFQHAGSFPLAVDIESSSACNYRCVFCQKTDDEYWNSVKEGNMDWDTFTTIVDECAEIGVYSMKLNWRGEPLLNDRIPEMITYMKKAGIHEVLMNTNGSKLTLELTDRIIHAGLDRIIFSCDGISEDTYNKIRRGGSWSKFYLNVSKFSERCAVYKSLGHKVPLIRINTAVMEENLGEIKKFKEMFDGIADELRFNTLYNPQQKNKYLKDRKRTKKRKGCPQIYQRMIISYDGDVLPCCADYKKQLIQGNVKTNSLKVIYQMNMDRLRTVHESGFARRINGCKSCDLFSLSQKKEDNSIVWS